MCERERERESMRVSACPYVSMCDVIQTQLVKNE